MGLGLDFEFEVLGLRFRVEGLGCKYGHVTHGFRKDIKTESGVVLDRFSAPKADEVLEASFRGAWILGNLNLVDYFPPGSQAF